MLGQSKSRGNSSRRNAVRILAFAMLATVFEMSLTETASAQLKPGVDKTLTAAGDWPIGITYYESPGGLESPAVILLHMAKSNRLVWKGGFAKQLQKAGYAVVAVDLRKHGDSLPDGVAKKKLTATDYGLMITSDLEAVKKFLLEEHHARRLNIRKTGIIGAGMSGPIALTFAQIDWLKRPHADAPTRKDRTPRGQDIRAIVLLSPERNLPRINSTKAIFSLRNPNWEVAFMLGYGKSNAKDRKGKLVKDMYNKLTGPVENAKRVYPPAEYATKRGGTDLLTGRLGVEKHILGFFNKHLKQLPEKWQDRHSRLDK